MSALKIGVLGAGAIGSYIGGRLVAAGADVVFVGRLGREIAEHGLTLTDYAGFKTVIRPEALRYTDDLSSLAQCQVILLAVKSMATQAASESLAAVLRSRTTIVSLQNGITNAATIAAALPDHAVAAGMVPFNVRHDEGGRFHQGTSGAVAVENEGDNVLALAAALRKAGLPVDLFDDLGPIQHTKLLFNLNNSVNALSGVPLREELSNRDYRRVVAQSMREGLKAMRAAGIKPVRMGRMIPWIAPAILSLPNALFFRAAAPMIKIDPAARSSMLDDLERKRPTEIDYLNGAIVALASKAGVPVPINRAIVALVNDAERAKRGSPKMSGADLWAAVSRSSQTNARASRA